MVVAIIMKNNQIFIMKWKCYLMVVLWMNYLQGKIIMGSFWNIILLKEYLLITKSFNLTTQEGLLVTIYLLMVGWYLLSLVYFGMKPLE